VSLVRKTVKRVGFLALLPLACARPHSEDDSPIVVVSPNASFVRDPGEISSAGVDQMRKESCRNLLVEDFVQAPVLQLAVDVSGSMSLPPPDESENKWVTTRRALGSAVAHLPEDVQLGAVFFPNQTTERNCVNNAGHCVPGPAMDPSVCVEQSAILSPAPIGPAGSAIRRRFDELLGRVNAAGGTPTHDAIEIALSRLADNGTEGEQFLLLITDGQPTFLAGCRGSGSATEPVDEGPILEAVSNAYLSGIRTFVVGSPGSEENAGTGEDARVWLSEAAIRGGSAPLGCPSKDLEFCHYDLSDERDFEKALLNALEEILGRVKACSFELPEVEEGKRLDLQAVNVALLSDDRAEILGRSKDGECTDGWRLESDGGRIQLCSEACGRLRGSFDSEVELFFSCTSAEMVETK
jgi:hypothetical protein